MMSFEQSNIPAFVLADLYKQVVITEEIPAEARPSATQPAREKDPVTAPGATYKFLGKNLQRVVVIVHSPNDAFLEEDSLQFLTKMLGACKLNLGDVAIVNDAAGKVDMGRLNEQLKPLKTLVFGVDPAAAGLPLTFPAFKEQEYAGCTYLLSPSLPELNQPSEEGKQLKGKLWACLKKLFNV